MSRLMPLRLVVLMALMTAVAFGGPLVFALVLRAGRNPDWPPGHAIEWWTLAGISILMIILMIMTIGTSIAIQHREQRAKMKRGSGEPEPGSERPPVQGTRESEATQ
jgi:hypothetical protein